MTDYTGQVWAHSRDEHRIYLLVRPHPHDSMAKSGIWQAMSLWDGRLRAFKPDGEQPSSDDCFKRML